MCSGNGTYPSIPKILAGAGTPDHGCIHASSRRVCSDCHACLLQVLRVFFNSVKAGFRGWTAPGLAVKSDLPCWYFAWLSALGLHRDMHVQLCQGHLDAQSWSALIFEAGLYRTKMGGSSAPRSIEVSPIPSWLHALNGTMQACLLSIKVHSAEELG